MNPQATPTTRAAATLVLDRPTPTAVLVDESSRPTICQPCARSRQARSGGHPRSWRARCTRHGA